VKTEPIQTDEDFIGSDIFLTKNQSKPNRYTPNCSFKKNVVRVPLNVSWRQLLGYLA